MALSSCPTMHIRYVVHSGEDGHQQLLQSSIGNLELPSSFLVSKPGSSAFLYPHTTYHVDLQC